MTEKFDIVFHSGDARGAEKFQIASGYISRTSILFEKENVIAEVEAKGSVEFYDRNRNLLATGAVPAVENGREVYEDILCSAEDDQITLKFPKYRWIDNYPNCDGEYDRWDTEICGYHTLTLTLSTASVETNSL